MREEFIWTTYIHEHPLYLIQSGHPEKVVDALADGFRKVCAAMAPRPVTLRFSDFKSSEYRDLKGEKPSNPMNPVLSWAGEALPGTTIPSTPPLSGWKSPQSGSPGRIRPEEPERDDPLLPDSG